ncbi:hypothetical protein LEP1GSC016_1759 [Leptospira borgpetersenii serovar Hardjo-bovis str. Sponselee]|uniref:Uncharacterized protein n=2 Tax=Leptospira borgpetersenii TaxID=174 RepID=M6C196_LEPBO|nr:hypothetical protein B9T54_14655 [Leptospira borgpetersenii serovar Hardjo-bovis]EMJ79900.1 hypothetical protein LEP1GSC016_1759 [Leptospira borgpetersenii serovar Hardjo-bovis str. Sponselee]EMO61855.1 hypothetical protein LEP1GSC133_2107 [Leptospira borgpetersenii serovar Pomona str. 200901868]TQE55099.1 hypothetical protein FFZ95_01780 [Leptospira borgpetersenii]AYR09513.1 hypothetical protein D1609_14765 [Leptospira borgpetersenii serovar Hardjo-bovis]
MSLDGILNYCTRERREGLSSRAFFGVTRKFRFISRRDDRITNSPERIFKNHYEFIEELWIEF